MITSTLLKKLLVNQHSTELSQYTLVLTLASLLDTRDPLTSEHSRRVGIYSELIGKALGVHKKRQSTLKLAGLLHDIGKIGIDRTLLYKPGKLSSDEMKEIKEHVMIGYKIIQETPQLEKVANIVLYHHERIDGKGYPCNLVGKEIPLDSKILSVADSFDAMVSSRLYRPTISPHEALEELKRCSGTQFDSKVVEVFGNYLKKRDFRLPKKLYF